MKRTITAALLISLVAGSAAMAAPEKIESMAASKPNSAQSHDNRRDYRNDQRNDHGRDARGDRRDDRRDWRDDRRDDRRDWRDDRRDDRRDWRDDRRDDRRDWRYDNRRIRANVYVFPRGYRAYNWRRGDHLPRSYYAHNYVVRDYRGCNLRPPPRGAHWVRVNQDVVLAAIATGIVMDVIHNHFY